MDAATVDLALLRKTELFSNLDQDELNFISSYSGVKSLSKGGLLFSSGEKADHFYILTSGEIRVFKKNSDDSEEEIAMFTQGDTIGDFDFARRAEYNAYAEAVGNSILIMFPAAGITIDSLVQEDPRIVCRVLLNAILMMTGRIKSTRKLILENMTWVQELHRRAYEDPGTGLWKQTLIADEITGRLRNSAALIMIKPDRFKILVDSRGHSAGDEAMIRIAIILKNTVRQIGRGWALRFKSNEVGIIIDDADASTAEKTAADLAAAITALEPVPASGEIPEFSFSATIVWALWPFDGAEWNDLFQNTYASLLENWRSGGERIIHYRKAQGNE